MRYLLDTHTVIWHFDDSAKLSQKAIEITDNPENLLYVCSISLWEIAIKMSLGKLNLNFTLDKFLAAVKESDINILKIEDEYLSKLSELPYIHKDPFDRLLISTALVENLTIITIDENMQKYEVPWIW